MKKALSCLLALLLTGMCFVPALAAQEEAAPPEMQAISPWAYDALADIYALGMWSDEYYYCILNPITSEQLEALGTVVSNKLAPLKLELNSAAPQALVVDGTRGGVKNALYQAVSAYNVPYVNTSVSFMLGELGVAYGDGSQNNLDARACTLQEALVMASRLVLSIYDYYNAGSLGFLWKAESKDVTLYLLGTIHTDRSNVYPLHSQLQHIITDADAAIFEVNLNDVEGMMRFAALQKYQDGSTLDQYIDAALFRQVVDAMATLGLPKEQTALYKPWALANTLQALALTDESTGSAFMALDSYVNAKAANVGVPIGAVETYEFQAGLFDSLSPAYQEKYLAAALALFNGEDTQDASPSAVDQVEDWMQFWKSRDIASFSASYDKDAYLSSSDELVAQLYNKRDPVMIQFAADLLSGKTGAGSGEHQTVILVVGAGHMIGETGIVQGLRGLGYTVEEVSAP